ncbi:autotransporter outer membrane beta-barrel domain-containing protein [Candidatus Pelagibacter sp.]|nr:autotransporter outer membrane beta-barrel domain-containing protein [Candidatus Pelagibacter sp.]
MKNIFKISFIVFSFLALFYSNAFAFIEFKQSKDISLDTTEVRGINFKPDGTIMYITNRDPNNSNKAQVTQYSLSTPFDISTATKISQTNLVHKNNTAVFFPHAIEFKPDGTKMFLASNNSQTSIYQYNLTTPWDSSTAVWEKRFQIGNLTESSLRTLSFKPDGTRMFTGGPNKGKIRAYILTNPWDLTSGVSLEAVSANLKTSSDTDFRNTQFDTTGSIMYIMGNTNNNIHKYTLSTPWDVTTLSSTSTEYDTGSRFSDMRGFIFAASFTKLFVTDDNGSTNTIFEYSPACAVTITCSDPSNDNDVKAIIEANVELSKRIIKNNTLPIFHRIEWLRRHKNKDNLSNLNAEIDFMNKKISKLVTALKSSKKEVDRSYDSEDWFQWSEGRISLGKNKSINSSSRDFHSYGISVGADKIKDDDRDAMHGYVFQYGNDNIDIGYKGSKLETDAYSFALYGTKLRDDHVFTDALIGVSLLDIDQKRVIYGNSLEGNREGQQIYGSFNFGKRIVDEDINLNPGIKLDLGYTKLKAFREKSNVANSLTDVLLYKEQNIKSALVTLGVLLDKTDKEEDEIINHHGRLEYIADLSPSSDAEFYYLNSQSTVYNYNVENKSKHNLRIGYGFDVTSISGWSLVGNFERFESFGKGYSNDIYLSVGYVPIDKMKFVFDVNNFENTSLSLTNNVNGFDLKMSSNYNFLSDVPDYGANIEISNKF